ncbi:MAG TPA: hypothetical protein VIQ78_01585 [Terrimesophilobacter sp.]|uniref:hypothetical protein n=1 Tax=Terrimesophilobacter sp. TaxID=2906435 RepID=UPI002F92B8CB
MAVPSSREEILDAVVGWGAALTFDIPSQNAIMAACAALAAGIDSPSLRVVAGFDLDAYRWDVFDALVIALDELGVDFPAVGTDEAKLVALEQLCRSFLAGELDLHQLTGWAHEKIGHEGPEAALPFVELDDEFDGALHSRDQMQHETEVAALLYLQSFRKPVGDIP